MLRAVITPSGSTRERQPEPQHDRRTRALYTHGSGGYADATTPAARYTRRMVGHDRDRDDPRTAGACGRPGPGVVAKGA